MTELQRITDDVTWQDLAEGDEARIVGRLDDVGGTEFTITFSDGSGLSVHADDAGCLTQLCGSNVEIDVVRTEDGLFATADALVDAMVAHGSI